MTLIASLLHPSGDFLLALSRQFFLFAHLAAFALAATVIMREDAALLGAGGIDAARLRQSAQTTKWLLVMLWITGAALIWHAVGLNLHALLANGKLMMKIEIVVVLTLNGALLHRVAFPMLTQPQRRPGFAATVCCLLGAVSGVSWIFAALVGAARYMAPKLHYADFLALYLAGLAVGVAVALVAVRPRLLRLIKTAAQAKPAKGAAAAADPGRRPMAAAVPHGAEAAPAAAPRDPFAVPTFSNGRFPDARRGDRRTGDRRRPDAWRPEHPRPVAHAPAPPVDIVGIRAAYASLRPAPVRVTESRPGTDAADGPRSEH